MGWWQDRRLVFAAGFCAGCFLASFSIGLLLVGQAWGRGSWKPAARQSAEVPLRNVLAPWRSKEHERTIDRLAERMYQAGYVWTDDEHGDEPVRNNPLARRGKGKILNQEEPRNWWAFTDTEWADYTAVKPEKIVVSTQRAGRMPGNALDGILIWEAEKFADELPPETLAVWKKLAVIAWERYNADHGGPEAETPLPDGWTISAKQEGETYVLKAHALCGMYIAGVSVAQDPLEFAACLGIVRYGGQQPEHADRLIQRAEGF